MQQPSKHLLHLACKYDIRKVPEDLYLAMGGQPHEPCEPSAPMVRIGFSRRVQSAEQDGHQGEQQRTGQHGHEHKGRLGPLQHPQQRHGARQGVAPSRATHATLNSAAIVLPSTMLRGWANGLQRNEQRSGLSSGVESQRSG